MAEKLYCVYEHVFPSGKKYIGISCNAEKRWMNGNGYKTQKKMWNAIQKYGWENVRHNIIVSEITKKKAEQIERYLIAELNTIQNGYNVAIGGENIISTYLDSYVLDMIRYVKKRISVEPYNDIAKLAYSDRYDKTAAEFWNEASRAVTFKHRIYSTTDEIEVKSYWFHMIEYVKLWKMVQNAEDTTKWQEELCPWEWLKA